MPQSLPPGAVTDDTGPSEVVFPPQQVPIRFDHAVHHRAGAKCVDCHRAAVTSTRASDKLTASGASCDRCHGTQHTALGSVSAGDGKMGACGTCHEGQPDSDAVVTRVRIPNPRLKFNHRIHAARNIGCGQCHGAVQRVGKATRMHLPRMRACLTCHDLPDDSRGDAKAGCQTCHLTDPSGRMRTQFDNGRLLPPRWMGAQHRAGFEHDHGVVAANDSRLCARCHGEDECAACHEGKVRPRNVHPNDFLSMHGVAAKQNAQSCSSCHRQSSFCTTCHMRAGVTSTGPPWARLNQGRIHPPSEVFVQAPVTSRHHATEARRNLMACVGCHVERDCVSCHATQGGGGMGVNPHPAGFASRCRSALSRNARPCLVCHEPGDARLSPCR